MRRASAVNEVFHERENAMEHTKILLRAAVALGIAVSGAATVSAQDWRWREANEDRRDLRQDYNDVSRDRSRIAHLQGEIARDHSEIDNDVRMGRRRAASEDTRDLARHQRELDALQHNMYRDQREVRQDRRDLALGYYGTDRRW